MFDESENKNGSQAQNFADEIVKNLSELMKNFIAAYKQIEQKKDGKLLIKFNKQLSLNLPSDLTSKVVQEEAKQSKIADKDSQLTA